MNSWDELSLFEVRELAESFYKAKHGGNLNAGKYNEIKTNIQQGKAYFKSASQSSELVKPVLLYYGVLSLSRAALLFMNPALREANLKPGHGISTVNWNNSLSGEKTLYEELSISFCSGTFTEFLKAGGNTEYFNVDGDNKNGFYFIASNTGTLDLENGYEISLHDLLSRIPDLEEMYRKIYGTPSQTFNVHVYEKSLEIVDNGIMFGYTNISDLKTKGIPGLICENGKIVTLSSSYKDTEGTERPFITRAWLGCQITYPFESNGKYFNISHLCKLYMASYFVGMLARYFPTAWMNLMGKGKGTRIYPVIEQALKVTETRYPEKIVRLMTENPADQQEILKVTL